MNKMNSEIRSSGSLKKKRNGEPRTKVKVFGKHRDFLTRINKTLYYGKLPKTERFSLPVTELAAEIFSKARFPGNSVQLSLRHGGRMLGLERMTVGEVGDITRSACISPCSLVLALIYVDRLRDCNPKYLEKTSPSKLFLVSLMVASKFLHDDGEEDEVFNDEWAASSGMDPKELNSAEREFLAAIDWRVHVKESQFWERLEALEEAVAFREGHQRGWFTYSDVNYLLQTKELKLIAGALITVSAVCLTSYTAAVLSILGSNIIVSKLPSPSTILVEVLKSPVPAIPFGIWQERDLNHTPDIRSMESMFQATTGCSITGDNQSHSMVQIEKSEPNSYIHSFLNTTLVQKVIFPEMKTISTLFNSLNAASRLFDSFFNRNNNIYSGLMRRLSKEEKASDLGFCIHLFNEKWVIGENISQSFWLLSHFWNFDAFNEFEAQTSSKSDIFCEKTFSSSPDYSFSFGTIWNSGTSTEYNEKILSSSKSESSCKRKLLSFSHDPPISFGTSQY
ncbi:hypothetical protein J437_LFUL008235 [Ladona fulva]|uniref:Protein CNPPD1 n=1 Tax=Ladona fulva TaxID=123851 RepID=A0A8K0K4V0_LADFU|nr:hypothetical protein J437_LFUL008235 [Ladona fulva]